jgi:plastocyanin
MTLRTRLPALRTGLALAAAAALLAGCGGSATSEPALPLDEASPGTANAAATAPERTAALATPAAPAPRRTPRRRELRVSMGEWAVVTDGAVRPGPVTLVITNRGKLAHGLELKAESGEGRSGGERFELESAVLRPGQTVRMRVTLPAGVYEIECFVGDHDDRGMQGVMRVRRGAANPAPKPAPPAAPAAGTTAGAAVQIAGFDFKPKALTVSAGQTVTWRNADPAEHNVEQSPSGFRSAGLAHGADYARTFSQPGRYPYVCSLHPGMRGLVTVTP